MEGDLTFSWVDYFLFTGLLTVSAIVGIFYAVKDYRAKKNSTEVYLMAGRDMGVLPVALSILASFLSAIFILGIPVEIYKFGIGYWLSGCGNILSSLVGAFVFLPIIHGLELTSAYTYIEMRFNRVLHVMTSALFCFQMMLYMAVVLYTPALALSQVMNLRMEFAVLATGILCTAYTAMGGMKAVIWTDAIQMIIVTIGVLMVVIQGSIESGGFDRIWTIATDGGRIKFPTFDPDPRIRNSFYALTIGASINNMTLSCTNQAILQRYLCVKKRRNAQYTMILQVPGVIILLSLVILTGLVMYSQFEDCDPFLTGHIKDDNQAMPYLVMQLLGHLKGIPGVFFACVFSAALSTLSSGINSTATVLLEDFIKPAYTWKTTKLMTSKAGGITARVLAVLLGMATLGLTFAVQSLGAFVLQLALSIFGITGGPLLGLFILAAFFPCVDSWGAGFALVISTMFTFWLGIGGIMLERNIETLPMSDKCLSSSNSTLMSTSSSVISYATTGQPPMATGLEAFYSISYWYYGLLAVIVSIIVGNTVSLITGRICKKSKKVPRELLFGPIGNLYYRSSKVEALKEKEKEIKMSKKFSDEEKNSKENSNIIKHYNSETEVSKI